MGERGLWSKTPSLPILVVMTAVWLVIAAGALLWPMNVGLVGKGFALFAFLLLAWRWADYVRAHRSKA